MLNIVMVFLFVWNLDEKLWDKLDFKGGFMRVCLICSFFIRNLVFSKNMLYFEFV